MSKVALVTHDAQTLQGRAGGVAAFVTHFARLLRQAGEEVTIVVTRQETKPVRVDEKWRIRYAEWGIGLIELHSVEPDQRWWSGPWAARLSQLVAPLLNGFDIAYFQDWANVAFHTARIKRFTRSPMPVLVTVLHGPSEWGRVANQGYPSIPVDLHLSYIERYSARHSDFVVSPSQYMNGWVRAHGWELKTEPSVLGLPYLKTERESPPVAAGATTRLIFFGRLQTRKGFSLFAAALRTLFQRDPAALNGITEIVLLGEEQEAGTLERVRRELDEVGIPVLHFGKFDSEEAGEYLAEHASDSLVVVPSPVENFPYAVIEASLIPGLNLLCSNGGGIPEVFGGRGQDHLFEPYPLGLAEKLAERLRSPSRAGTLPAYDAEAANARWLHFHRDAVRKTAAVALQAAMPTVDVCIPYFNQPRYLQQILTALERQTAQHFGVIVVDDGSEPEARAAFDQLRDKYRERGWKFVSQPNSFVDAARNHAASLSTADFLLFVDPDDVPALNTVERMTEAITLSGDDFLVPGGMLFADDNLPYDLDSGKLNTPVLARYMPLGPDPICGLVDPMVLGHSMILVRRAALEQVGGYRTKRGAGHEDWELQIRLVMAGYRVDVLPEFLVYFRKMDSGLSRTLSEYEAKLRLIETYDNAFAKVGLHGVAATVISLLKRRAELESAAKENQDASAQRLHVLVGEVLRRNPAVPVEERVVSEAIRRLGAGSGAKESVAPTNGRVDFVFLNILQWSDLTQRPHHFARGLARRGHRVFWIDVKLTPPQRFTGATAARKLADNVFEIQLPGWDGYIYDFVWNPGVLELMTGILGQLRKASGIGQAIQLVNFPGWTPLAQSLRRHFQWPIVYDCLDDQHAFSELYRHGAAAFETELTQSCDVLTTSGCKLHETKLIQRKDAILIRNAVDYDIFHAAASRGLLDHLTRPVIGFFGVFADWLDCDWVAEAARRFPSCSFVYIGCEGFAREENRVRWRTATSAPNIHLFPQADLATLAGYLAQFDLCTMPFQDLPITRSMHAVKIYEYLAAGKHVIAPALPEMRAFAEEGLLFTYDSRQRSFDLIETLAGQPPSAEQILARTSFAARNQWEERVDRLIEAARLASKSEA